MLRVQQSPITHTSDDDTFVKKKQITPILTRYATLAILDTDTLYYSKLVLPPTAVEYSSELSLSFVGVLASIIAHSTTRVLSSCLQL